MNFEQFVTEILTDLKNNNNHALTLLNQNKELIQKNLGTDANIEVMDQFVCDLTNVVIQNTKNKFNIIENVLKHSTMTNVYQHFKNSKVMIKSVQMENKHAFKWLKLIGVSPYVQDENGMNVLMHMVRKKLIFDSHIKTFASDKICANQTDINGRTALFHALNCSTSLWKLLECDININHQDNEGNTALIYCCKIENYSSINSLFRKNIDVNAVDHDGKTAAMYLAMKGKYSTVDIVGGTAAIYENIKGRRSLFQTLQSLNCNFNYVNDRGESVLSLLLKQMYIPKFIREEMFDKYISTLVSLLFTNCDFNMPVDEDGNTASMVFLLVNDMDTYNFVLKYRDDIDLTKKNKYDENAIIYFQKYKEGKLNSNIIGKNTNYADVNLTENVIQKEKYIYKALEKELGISGKINRSFEYLFLVPS